MKKVDISKEKLKKMYLEDNLSLEKIGKIYGVSRNTIRNKVIEYNLQKEIKNKKDISKEELYELYINQNLLQKEIAETKQISIKKIQRLLKKYGIKKPKELFYFQIKKIVKDKYGVGNVSQLQVVKDKVKETVIKKYGVDNVSKNVEIKNKKKEKAIQKYGVDCVLKDVGIRTKINNTIKEKYGVNNISQSSVAREKTKKTNLERYGVEYPGQNESVKQKVIQTNLKRYGAKTVFQSEIVKKKIKQTNLNKYGNNNILGSPIIKERIKQTCLEKYGVPYFCMTEKCRKANGNAISKINKEFSKRLKENNIRNKLEKSIENYSYDVEILNTNILLELNPTYTHNSTHGSEFRGHKKKPLKATYHFNKTIVAKENGYQCIHIWDWDNCYKIINLLKSKETIYARKCYCKNISKKQCDDFLETYHLQGSCRGQKVLLGLFYNNKLVEVMTFGKPRYNSKYEWELLRLCSVFDYNIIGGASKLFSYFIEKYNPKNIISYCDNSKFNGNVYKILGFKLLSYGNPSKHWYNMKTKQHITDNLLRQRGYDQLFNTNYGKGSSNKELMIQNGFVEIYDCGQSTYIWKNNSF